MGITKTEIPLLDLRGKSIDEVVKIVCDVDINQKGSRVLDISDLYPDLSQDSEYVSVTCVWLRSVQNPKKIEFILWNGKKAPWRCGCDLHGFVKGNGEIDWGQNNTMNLMR